MSWQAKIQKEEAKKVAVQVDENVPAPSPRCNGSVRFNFKSWHLLDLCLYPQPCQEVAFSLFQYNFEDFVCNNQKDDSALELLLPR